MAWHALAITGIGGAAWAVVTGIITSEYDKDFYTSQGTWAARVFEAPFKFFAGLVGAPAKLIREHWAHQEKMMELSTHKSMEKRLQLLEDIAVND
jgi:hypothetical protein